VAETLRATLDWSCDLLASGERLRAGLIFRVIPNGWWYLLPRPLSYGGPA
jgi:hypothetical protein